MHEVLVARKAGVRNLWVIDDDEIYQFALQRMLRNNQYVGRLTFFEHGQEAMDYFRLNLRNADDLPEIILLDLNMPVMDGWDFLDEYIPLLGALPKKIDLYVVSSTENPSEINRAKSNMAVRDFIVKPVTQDILGYILRE